MQQASPLLIGKKKSAKKPIGLITQDEDLKSRLKKSSCLAFRCPSASFPRLVYLTNPVIVLHFTSSQVNNCHSVPTTGFFFIFVLAATSFDLIVRQTLGVHLTRVSSTDSRWERTCCQCIYKCTVSTTWQVSISEEYLPNVPITGSKLYGCGYFKAFGVAEVM